MKPLYEIYTGEQLLVAEKIQRRRLQILVHSYIYYELNDNLVSDSTWSNWAVELKELQEQCPEIERVVPYRKGFENWDASTGAFLPYNDDNIVNIAYHLIECAKPKITKSPIVKTPKTSNNFVRKKLF